MGPDGAWLQLAWTKKRTISEVQLTFDTGFHRELTLSEQTNRQKKMVLGPQPETIKDYAIEYRTNDGAFETLADVKGNYLRLRRHTFDPIETDAIRIRVAATNGAEEARIYEVRCYA
jgi:hypothetical protein